jgi:DNA-binding transcriptional LysR family regulator
MRAFEAAGRLASIRQAASELHVTPAAVSRQVRLLEEYLGVRLFTSGHRAVTLTPAGRQYLADIRTHLAGIRRATGKLLESRRGKVLNIRAYTTFAMRWLIPRLSSFHSCHPDVEVRLTTSLEGVDFEREEVDAAIRLGCGPWAGLQADRLVPNTLLPVCSPTLVAGAALPLDASMLSSQTLLHSLARADGLMPPVFLALTPIAASNTKARCFHIRQRLKATALPLRRKCWSKPILPPVDFSRPFVWRSIWKRIRTIWYFLSAAVSRVSSGSSESGCSRKSTTDGALPAETIPRRSHATSR